MLVGASPRREPEFHVAGRHAEPVRRHGQREQEPRQVEMKQRPKPARSHFEPLVGVVGLSHRNLRREGKVYRDCATRAGARAMTASSRSRSLSNWASVAPSSTRPRGSFTFIGSTKRSLMRISKCTWEPVDNPVEPTKPMIWPWRTFEPTSRPRANAVMWP